MSVKKAPPRRRFDPETNEPLTDWTKTSNMVEELIGEKVSGKLQLGIILKIARETWGARESRAWTPLSVTKSTMTFCCTRQAFTTATFDAVARGLIETKNFKNAKFYRLTQWANVLRYVPPKSEQPVEIAIDEQKPLYLFPGRHSRPIQLKVFASEKTRDSVGFRVYNELKQPLSFTIGYKDSEVILTLRPEFSTESQNEGKVSSTLGRRSAVSSPTPAENKEVNEIHSEDPKSGNSTGFSTDVQKPAARRKPRLDAFRAALEPVVLAHWGKPLDDALLIQIVTAAGEASPEHYLRIVTRKLAIDRDARHTTGILIPIARDAAKAHARLSEHFPVKDPELVNVDEFRRWARSLPPDDYAELVRRDPTFFVDEASEGVQ